MKRSGIFRGVDFRVYLFVLPILLLYVTFSILPILRTFWESFFTGNMVVQGDFVKLKNYISIINDGLFQQAFLNTLLFTAVSIVFTVSFSVILAVLLDSPIVRAPTFFKIIFFLPVVTSFVAVGYIWKWMYNPSMGIINRFLEIIGLSGPGWLSDPKIAMGALILVNVWKWIGYFMVIVLAYLQLIDHDLYEAAYIDGAKPTQIFLLITIPLLFPAILLCVILGMIYFLRTFAIVLVMTQGGPSGTTELITTFVYNEAFGTGRMRIGYSAAASMILFLLIMLLTLLLSKIRRE